MASEGAFEDPDIMFEQLSEQLASTSWVEWLGMASGILGVWFSVKEKAVAWPLFITCYSCYVFISFQYGLYAFLFMNIVFIGLSVYGWTNWLRKPADGLPSVLVSRMSKSHWPWVAVFLIVGSLGIGRLLDINGEASLPYLDAFATCCGFTAQWMLGRKHIETWRFWIVSDCVYLGIFIQGPSWPSVILFVAFIGLAIRGWFEWRKRAGMEPKSSTV